MKRSKKSERIATSTIGQADQTAGRGTDSTLRLQDLTAQNDIFEAIRQGVDDVEHGRTHPAREFFDAFRQKYRIKR
jgi:hypothetical protein